MEKKQNPLQLRLCKEVAFTDIHQMPIVKAFIGDIPNELISFNRARTLKCAQDKAIHFYI